jgi:hypothetical protein
MADARIRNEPDAAGGQNITGALAEGTGVLGALNDTVLTLEKLLSPILRERIVDAEIAEDREHERNRSALHPSSLHQAIDEHVLGLRALGHYLEDITRAIDL